MKARVEVLRTKGKRLDKPIQVDGSVGKCNNALFVTDDNGKCLAKNLQLAQLVSIWDTGFLFMGFEGENLESQEWFIKLTDG